MRLFTCDQELCVVESIELDPRQTMCDYNPYQYIGGIRIQVVHARNSITAMQLYMWDNCNLLCQ